MSDSKAIDGKYVLFFKQYQSALGKKTISRQLVVPCSTVSQK